MHEGTLRKSTITAATALFLLAGCSAGSHPPAARTTTTPIGAVTTTTVPTGPAATITGPVTGGKGINLLAPGALDLSGAGYGETEFFASGTASSFAGVGPLGTDGRWQVQPKASAAYKTRIVVRAPRDPAKFNGTVLVEWLNVTAGTDTPADFAYLTPEILRGGYVWVGVSAQKVGVMGGGAALPLGGVPAGGLLAADPARYGSLKHPGDEFAFDMFSQIGRAVRTPDPINVLGSLHPQRVIAIGESQSAATLTTYIDAIQPVARIFDGFLVHSRFSGAFPLSGGSVTDAIGGAVRIREDIGVPVLLFETETDEAGLRYFFARQPDSADIRLWDVAGGSHADSYIIGSNVSLLGCKGTINEAPTHFVLDAALHQLDQWVRTGTAPPSAPRMDVRIEGGAPVVQRDALGVAVGGVRSAAIDVPVAAYSGVPADPTNVICGLFGSTHPFDAATLHRLYPTKAAYVTAFTNATDRAIAAGYLLLGDRPAILAQAESVNL
jgi:hypothetical protein